jgi:hypothetical protein
MPSLLAPRSWPARRAADRRPAHRGADRRRHPHPPGHRSSWSGRRLGPRRLNLVTDAMGALGMPPGKLPAGRLRGHRGRHLLPPGQMAPWRAASWPWTRRCATWSRFTGCPLEEALQTITTTPARAIGLDHERGQVAAGLRRRPGAALARPARARHGGRRRAGLRRRVKQRIAARFGGLDGFQGFAGIGQQSVKSAPSMAERDLTMIDLDNHPPVPRDPRAAGRAGAAAGWRSGQTAAALAAEIRRRGVDHVVIAARGTSDNAARYAQYLLGAHNGLSVGLATPSLFSIYQQTAPLRQRAGAGHQPERQEPRHRLGAG